MKKLTVLVTGATSGIGRHAALALAKEGHHVIAAGRRVEALEALAAEAKAAGAKLDPLRLDVTDASSIASAVRDVRALTFGNGLDALVNNAGFGQAGPLETVSDDVLRAQFETNVFGLMALTRAFIPDMRAKGFGRIVNVSSIGGKIVFPMMGAYHATKFAVEALSDALRNEVAPFGIGVSLIEPGAIRTEFTDRMMGTLAAVTTESATTTPYAASLAKADQMEKLFAQMGVGPESVTRAIRSALVSRRPRARYVAPFSANFILAAFRWIPTRIMDALLRAVLGLRRAPALIQSTVSST
jgi:NAD(P)-dependent dehydrogenase (short-subunit alcohol dehydrogenase family)